MSSSASAPAASAATSSTAPPAPTTTTVSTENSYEPLLNASVSAMKVDYMTTLQKYEEDPDKITKNRHFFPNKVSADFRNNVEQCFRMAAEEEKLSLFAKDLLEAWKDLVQFIFLPPKDIRENPIPSNLADWVAGDLLFRLRGKRNTAYEHFVRKHGLIFQSVIEEVRSTIGSALPLSKAVQNFKRNRDDLKREKEARKQQQEKEQQEGTTTTTTTTHQQRDQNQSKSSSTEAAPLQQNHQSNTSIENITCDDKTVTEEVRKIGKRANIPSSFSLSTFGSDASLDSPKHSQQQLQRPMKVYQKIIVGQREENAKIAQILHAIFSPDPNLLVANNSPSDDDSSPVSPVTKSISLHALFEICRARDAFRQRRTEEPFEKVHSQFSKRIFQIVQRGLVPDCHLAVTDSTVINVTALVADATAGSTPSRPTGSSSSNSANAAGGSGSGTSGSGAVRGRNQEFPSTVANSAASACDTDMIVLKPPTIVNDDPYFDPYFNILAHLLFANFHIKPNKALGIVPDVPYSGHNICCVAVDGKGKIVGLDFNQCKQDQNLCSHAEKRLSEALNEKLKSTVAPNTPPSLADYTFISSLEPCHMCCNFISRMGVKRIGFLQKDPMQCNALNIASSMLGLTIVRPSLKGSNFIAEALENSFKLSDFPEEEITSWLGSAECKKLLGELKERAKVEEGGECDKFMKVCGTRYPGVVIIDRDAQQKQKQQVAGADAQSNTIEITQQNNNIANANDDLSDEDGENMQDFGMIYTTSSVLAGMYEDDENDDEEDGTTDE